MHGKFFGKFSGVEEVVAEDAEGVVSSANGDARAAAPRFCIGLGGLKTEVEQGAEDVGAAGDVVAGALPLQHGLVQNATGVDERVKVVVIIHQSVETGSGDVNGVTFGKIQDVFVFFTHIIH